YAKRAPLRSHHERFAGHQRGGAVAHRAPDDEAALDDEFRLYAEKGGPPDDDVGDFPGFQRTHMVRYAESAGGIDRIFRDIALDPFIVAGGRAFLRQPAPL